MMTASQTNCITDKLHEDKIVKKARKEGNMEDSFNIFEQNSLERGVCIFLLKLRFKKSIMLVILD